MQLCFTLILLFPIALMAQPSFDLQGHRGCRGLMPENTLPAFLKAVELGVNTLEMDVVISADGLIVVSHEPWMSYKICSHPDGRPVEKDEEMDLNIYKMSYTEIQTYDCGWRMYPKFPEQQKIKTFKPTLEIVVTGVQSFAAINNYTQPRFNIEIKSEVSGYNTYQPGPEKFVQIVVSEIRRLGIEGVTTLQSFDTNILEQLNQPSGHTYAISYLVEKGKKLKKNLSKLTFTPDIYSPLYKLVSASTVTECHEQGMRIIPWTINDRGDMERLKAWGCDGGITDYPDRMK